MKQYIPMSADYFIFMNDNESSDTFEDAFEQAKTLLTRRPYDNVLIMKVEKIVKAKDITVDTEEVSLEDFKNREIDDPFVGLFAELHDDEAVDEGEDVEKASEQ